MKIYIFKPSKDWSYCGGALIVIANSLPEVQEMVKDGGSLIFLDDELAAKNEECSDKWTLVEFFEAPETEKKARIVYHDYNWA